MLPEHELYDLAQCIKEFGQKMPIVLDPDGVLLDGRNRLAACELAGVEPRFTTYTGTDQTAYIWAANVRRRHVTEGQRAMVHAMVLAQSGQSLRTYANLHSLSRTRLSLANTVLKYSPDLAEQVRDGKLRLDAAADIVRQHNIKAQRVKAKHDRLLQHAPDLAAQVTEGELTLDTATATLDQRLEDEQLRRKVEEIDAIRRADRDPGPALTELADSGDIDWQQAHQCAEDYITQRQAAISRDRQRLAAIADSWATVRNLACQPDSLYTHQVLDGLTPLAHELANRLLILVAEPETADRHG
ncbi:ParB/RepB/Spo0J family partition protein [Kitasatospora sp. NPDC008050]|uniref:ParB/RepB/Spo0J family partition protein n=1 Tax=Kitasatospora sp. NPDC008050 TaxID=3364021 RepID=UPI0036EDCAF3